LDHQHDAGAYRFGFLKDSMNETSHPTGQSLVLILGLGETGDAAARWLARLGTPLVLVDTREQPASVQKLREDLAGAQVDWHLGSELPAALLEGVGTLVISPGLSPIDPVIAPFLDHATKAGIEIIGEIELFARALHQLASERDYRPKLLGVTGTNGKTTVTALTRHMLQACGIHARVAGNISPAALAALMDALDHEDLPQAWVLELSSFQLQATHSLFLDVAVVLNVTQDHLDWHGTMDDYIKAKARIFQMTSIYVINRDDPVVCAMVASLEATEVRTFGKEAPVYAQDVGTEINHDVRWLVSAEPEDFEEDRPKPARGRRKAVEPLPRPVGRLVRLMPADALPLTGLHNALNVLAASLLALAVGGRWAPILKAATQYEGEPHRMRFVRTVREVDFYNDSKGTNVGATVAGVQGLDKTVVLIAGGLAKGQDFSALAVVLAQNARAVVLIGQDAPLLRHSFEQAGVTCVDATDMNNAVARAFELAESGDMVVLSPACASFDMFRSYPHRGEVFISAVQELALSVGEVA